MSADNLKEVLHYSNRVMKPFTRLLTIGVFGYITYLLVSPAKSVERIRPNYLEYRKQKGLPEVELKYPGFCVKELRVIPDNEVVERTTN